MPRSDHCWDDIVPQEEAELLRTGPERPRAGPGLRPALLAIDMFEKAYAGGDKPVRKVNREFPGSCGANAWRTLEPTRRLFDAARSARIPIVYTWATPPSDQRVQATNRKSRHVDPESYRIRADFAPQPQDLIITKQRASAMFGTPLLHHLQRLRVDSLIVVGQSTSGCVRASTVEGAMYGFPMTVVEECCFDRSLLSHNVAMWDLHCKYADVMHVEEVVNHLGALQAAQ